MAITATVVAGVAIYGLIALSIAYMCSLVGLYGQMTALAKYRPDVQALLPNPPSRATPYTSTYVLIWWAWTGAHRAIGDRAISRGVAVSRVLCIATVVGWAALFLSPRDFAERTEAWSKGERYVQTTD
jgi:hypothetical protein